MTDAIVLPEGKQSFQTATGAPLAGGRLYTYAAGTSTPKPTWADAGKVSVNTNPIVLDARGEATIFWDGAYKVELRDAADVPIWTVDNVSGIDTSAVQYVQSWIDGQYVSAFDYLTEAEKADVIAGTLTIDVAPKLQQFIDDCIYFKRRSGFFPAGKYRCDRRLHFGYGTTFTSAHFTGAGKQFRGVGGTSGFAFGGTALVFTSWTDAGVNFQGMRLAFLRDISLIGPNMGYLITNEQGGLNPLVDDLIIDNWVDPTGLAANPDFWSGRYRPIAGVAIDAYSGPRPSQSYPDVDYPTWLGSVTQYNKVFSSQVSLEGVEISGFGVGLAIQPCDADGNADFITLDKSDIMACVLATSIGNSQSRNVSWRDGLFDQCYALFTNTTHGRQIGQYGGHIDNLSGGRSIKYFYKFFTGRSAPMVFTNCYSELVWQLGEVTNSGTAESALVFNGCLFNFADGHPPRRGVPPYIASYSDTDPVNFGTASLAQFNGCQLVYDSVLPLFGPLWELRNTSLSSSERRTGTVPAYVAAAHNGLAGGLIRVVQDGGRSLSDSISYLAFNRSTGVGFGAVIGADMCGNTGRNIGIPVWVDIAVPGLGPPIFLPQRVRQFSKASWSGATLVGRTLTATFSSWPESSFAMLGPDAGDVILDLNSGSVFFVSARTGTTITAILQNNYRELTPGDITLHRSFSTTAGDFVVYNCRLYAVPSYLRGDTTSGSSVLTNVARDDGFKDWDAQIAVDDWLWVDAQSDSTIPASSARVVSKDEPAGTITLAGAASRTQERKRLQLWIRKAAS